MKNLVLLVACVFTASTLIGCSKKQQDDATSLEEFNGVVSENVISIDQAASDVAVADTIGVVVDNAQYAVDNAAMGVMDAASTAAATLKPTAQQIQQALKNAGFYAGNIDGNIGPKTKKAIEEFQAKNGLKADGKVGAKTWKVLSSYLAKAPEVVNPTDEIQTVGQ